MRYPIPKLSSLPAHELAAVVGYHLGRCPKHPEFGTEPMSLTEFDLRNETFRCLNCGATDAFDICARHANSVEEYVCRFLSQGRRFYLRHERSCTC